MASSVRFSLRGPSKRKRASPAASSDQPHALIASAALHSAGIFLSAEDAAREAVAAAETADAPPPKKAMLLEDMKAKVKRLQAEGNTLAESGRFRAAIDRWQEALAVDARQPVIYELMAQAAMAVGDDFEAVQFGLKAVEFGPNWGDAYLTLARCHLNFGELELAYENITKAEELLGASEELTQERREVEEFLEKQREILLRRDAEAEGVDDADKRQVISCMKHLSLRGQVR